MIPSVDCTASDFALIEMTKQVARRLHVSGIHEVASSVETSAGDTYSGIHMNASVGFADVCGEVAAICAMVGSGHRDLATIVAVWSNGQEKYSLFAPCGRCRELISDLNPEARVIVGTLDAPYVMSIAELLPLKGRDRQ